MTVYTQCVSFVSYVQFVSLTSDFCFFHTQPRCVFFFFACYLCCMLDKWYLEAPCGLGKFGSMTIIESVMRGDALKVSVDQNTFIRVCVFAVVSNSHSIFSVPLCFLTRG